MAGRSGTHLVCVVCTIYQNVKLMFSAISVKMHYMDLLQACVCNMSNKCITGNCSCCPGTNQIKMLIINWLLERYNNDDSICYMQIGAHWPLVPNSTWTYRFYTLI